MSLPVLVIAYKRPDLLKRCLAKLMTSGVDRIYVAVDGPRGEGDVAANLAVRDMLNVLSSGADIRTRYADRNYGCRAWVSSSISWFFSQEEFGVVVEEDILLDGRFFPWCESLRDRYAADPRIMHINAFTPLVPSSGCADASLTRYATSWGWASWRRSWQKYDDAMAQFFADGLRRQYQFLREKVGLDRRSSLYYIFALRMTHQEKLSSWAYRWNYSVWKSDGFAVSPNINLSHNMGVGEGAQHTAKEYHLQAITVAPEDEQLVSEIQARNPARDQAIFRSALKTDSLFRLCRMAISCLVPSRWFFSVRRLFR